MVHGESGLFFAKVINFIFCEALSGIGISPQIQEEDVDMNDEALELLTTIATNTSLRYAMNMIITSSLAARKRKSNTVGKDDVGKVFKLFSDVGRSVKVLTEDKDSYLYSKVQWFVC